MYKTIIRFSFCDIQNNQGQSRDDQPKPKFEADNPYQDQQLFNIFITQVLPTLKSVQTSLLWLALGNENGNTTDILIENSTFCTCHITPLEIWVA